MKMVHQEKNMLKRYSSREKLVEALDDEMARAQRYVKPLSLLMISIDWCGGKQRQLQSAEEERFMQQVVGLFTQNVRVIDKVYLYEKGIYIVLLPETDKVEALSTAKRLQKIVQRAQFPSPGGNHHAAIRPVMYMGIVSYPWDANTQSEIFEAAKFALQEAINSDQGQICFLDFEYQHLRNGSRASYKVRSV
jgi:diguanylate cyclase (GGDEF)-like protein